MRKDVAALVKALPKTIRIGPHDWQINTYPAFYKDENDDDLWGYCQPRKNTLGIANLNETPSTSALVSVFMHELFHAIWYTRAVPTKTKVQEEDCVVALEMGWTQLFRDNPWLLDWLKKGLR